MNQLIQNLSTVTDHQQLLHRLEWREYLKMTYQKLLQFQHLVFFILTIMNAPSVNASHLSFGIARLLRNDPPKAQVGESNHHSHHSHHHPTSSTLLRPSCQLPFPNFSPFLRFGPPFNAPSSRVEELSRKLKELFWYFRTFLILLIFLILQFFDTWKKYSWLTFSLSTIQKCSFFHR